MNILILQGSPRANGNTAWMAEEYRKAAEAAGHTVELNEAGRETVVHELQHAIQLFEGFAKGGNPTDPVRPYNSKTDTPIGQYYKFAGEVEARNVQQRLTMTPEERAATPPWETEDVPEDRQIVRMGGGISALAIRRDEYDRWNRVLDEYERGEMKPNSHATVFEHTPAVLRRLGAPDLPVNLSKDIIDKITGIVKTQMGEEHKVPVSELRNLQIELDNPIAVFDSRSRQDAMVVLTRIIDNQNRERAVVALHLDKVRGAIHVNDIASMYGKDKQSIENWTAWGLLRYVNKQARKASAKWFQLPSDSELRARSVLTEKDFSGEKLGRIISQPDTESKGVSPAEDAAYMDAVRRGDMETAQRMRLEAAERKGYKLSNGFFVVRELAAKVPQRTKGDLWAFETGRKLATRGFDNSRLQWETVDFSEEFEGGGIIAPLENLFYGEPPHVVSKNAYFNAGVNGDAMPEFVFARRIGIVPDSGESYNFRDQIGEGGVSVLGVYDANGFQEQNNGTYRLFNGGKEYLVAGYKIEKRGSDGEPLLVRARTLGEADGAIKSADAVTYDDAGNVIPLSKRFDRTRDDVRFDTPELTPAEAEYAAREDKTPTEKVMREVYGMTNDEIATALRAAGMEPPPHVRKPDETTWRQADALLSNPSYMAKLSRAVAKFPRPIRDYENAALNILLRQREAAVNEARGDVDDWNNTLNSIPDDATDRKAEAAKELAAAQAELTQVKVLMAETAKAAMQGASEQGRSLRSNRFLMDAHDYSYAGIAREVAKAVGGIDKITPEMDAQIREIAADFAKLDEDGRDLATARLKAHAAKIVNDIKNGGKIRKAVQHRAGDEAKRVTRNYIDALAQIEVGAAEVGGTLIGLSDQQYPSWGKWLRQLGEFHCFENPDITEEEVIDAILADISPFMDGVDANQVRDALTGFGHNFKQSRYDSQRLMNDLRSQSRMKRQLDWMDETNTMPPLTCLVRDEPSDTTRNLQKQVQERKKEVPDAGRDERRLKGVLDSAKTRVRNRIADLERAIATGEQIPAAKRSVVEDIELRELKRRKDELQKQYDELFKSERGMTDEQRIALTEKLLAKSLEHALEDLDRARSGDFSKRPKRIGLASQSLTVLRDRLSEVREQIRELKKAKYEFGMTPEELSAYNARKMANREKVVARLAERVATGDIRPQKKPQPPMTPEQQKKYDELGEQMKRGRQKLAELRLEAENATVPTFWRKSVNFLRFVTTAQRTLRATMDFSAVLRQAARMTLAHPVKAGQAFGKAWTAAHSEASLRDVNDEIMSDPTVREAVDKFGLHLREVDAENGRDVDMFHGMERNKIKILGKEYAITDIPFFGEFMLKSERHYLTYLNAMSAELYSSIVNDHKRFPGGATAWQKKMVADMINIWNGSAALSKERRQALQKAWVNDVFWAPQLAISRVQSATGYDWWHPLIAKGIKNAEGGYDKPTAKERMTAAKIGLSEHLKSTFAIVAIGALLKWMFSDDDDKYDFSQADWFEKMMMLVSPKVGNTTIDLTGGESTFDRLAHQVATKSKRSGTGRLMKFGDFNAPTVMGAIGRYLQGKLSPSVSTLGALWEGRDFVGDEFTPGKAVQEMLVPLTFEDIKDQMAQNGVGKSLVTIPLTLLGAGGSTYDRKPYENAVNRFLESKKEFDKIEEDELLDEPTKKLLLDSIRDSNPLMRDEVRGDIDADIKRIRRDETRAEKDATLLPDIDNDKAALMEKIRSSRRKQP